jgi:cysteine desulfurase
MSESRLYFDANATTMMPRTVLENMVKFANYGNPASAYSEAKTGAEFINRLTAKVARHCGINLDKEGQPIEYKIIFTSGASESNATILSGVIDSFEYFKKVKPHVVASAIEHKSILDLLDMAMRRNKIDVTYIEPGHGGHIAPERVKKAIRPNTCLVCVMHANNESGAINDVKEIGRIAHEARVPFHCDVVQSFGKMRLIPEALNIDSMAISFHKMYGPVGLGMLIVKTPFWEKHEIPPLIYGSQNGGLRGGTQSIALFAAANAAFDIVYEKRQSKNESLDILRGILINDLGAKLPIINYAAYIGNNRPSDIYLVLLSEKTKYYLPNTLLMAIVMHTDPLFCNVEARKFLEARGIIVSIGSACNTASKKASHVLVAMGADIHIKRGALRISFSDNSTIEGTHKLAAAILDAIAAQTPKKGSKVVR